LEAIFKLGSLLEYAKFKVELSFFPLSHALLVDRA